MRLFNLLILLTAFLLTFQNAFAADCIDLNNYKQAISPASVVMKRHIPYAFEHLTRGLSEKSQKNVVVGFSVSETRVPVNISVKTSSGNAALDKAAIEAVRQSAPFRQAGGCYSIQLTYIPSKQNATVDTEAVTDEAQRKTPESGLILKADKNIRDQVMRLGGGDDTYYYPDTMEGMDIIDDSSGKADVLVFGKKKLSEAKLKPISSNSDNKRIDGVMIDFGEANSVTIFNYFDGSSPEVKNAKPGAGLIEKIVFAGGVRLGFEDIKERLKDEDLAIIIGKDKLLAPPKNSQAALQNTAAIAARKVMPGRIPQQPSVTEQARGVVPRNPIAPIIKTPKDSKSLSLESRQRWVQSVKCRIASNWKSPSVAASEKMKFLLEIEPSGNLKSVKLQASSGDKLLDEVALKKIKSSAPFKMPPSGVLETVPFSFGKSEEVGCLSSRDRPTMLTGKPGTGGHVGPNTLPEPDFGNYIAELQRRIRRNWSPPVEERTERVVALFKVSRDGRVLSLRIQQSSGSSAAEQAALAAIRASAPFKQLPSDYRGNDIDVQFIFDYELYQQGGRAHML